MTEDNTPTAAPDLLTLEETVALLRTPAATLRYWRHLGTGPDGFRLGRPKGEIRQRAADQMMRDRVVSEALHRVAVAERNKTLL